MFIELLLNRALMSNLNAALAVKPSASIVGLSIFVTPRLHLLYGHCLHFLSIVQFRPITVNIASLPRALQIEIALLLEFATDGN